MYIAIQGKRVTGLARGVLRQRLLKMLAEEGCPTGFELSILLTGDDEISRLHQTWMSVDGPTDVLSFPQDSIHSDIQAEGTLGDVVVSVDTAMRQAAEHGHSLRHEVMLLAVHGTLHLLGYDDSSAASRKIMRLKEKRYVPEAFESGVDTK